MTAYSHYALQKSIIQLLVADSALASLVSGVYDHVPQKTPFPYVAIGRWESEDWSSQTTSGLRHTITLAVWSREGGKKQAVQIMERLYTLLHDAQPSVEGQQLVMLRCVGSSVSLEDDGCTYRGEMRLRALVHA